MTNESALEGFGKPILNRYKGIRHYSWEDCFSFMDTAIIHFSFYFPVFVYGGSVSSDAKSVHIKLFVHVLLVLGLGWRNKRICCIYLAVDSDRYLMQCVKQIFKSDTSKANRI